MEESVPLLVAVTGAPCSGKTSTLRRFKRRVSYRDRAWFLRESMTLLNRHYRFQVPYGEKDREDNIRFFRNFSAKQKATEDLALLSARREGRRVVIADRGVIDSAAYGFWSVDLLMEVMRSRVEDEYARYHMVICFGPPPEHVWDEQLLIRPDRHETDYRTVLELGERTRAVWAPHPNFYYFDTFDINAKRRGAHELLLPLLAA